jgi:hypothetical protein
MDCVCLAQDNESSCERGNVTGSIQCWEILERLHNWCSTQESKFVIGYISCRAKFWIYASAITAALGAPIARPLVCHIYV